MTEYYQVKGTIDELQSMLNRINKETGTIITMFTYTTHVHPIIVIIYSR